MRTFPKLRGFAALIFFGFSVTLSCWRLFSVCSDKDVRQAKWLSSLAFTIKIKGLSHWRLFSLAATWRWPSLVRSTPERPSPASTSPSTRPRSLSASATTPSTPPCPTCPLRAARWQTRTDGWPIASPGRLACPPTTLPGLSATSRTKRHEPRTVWRWVPAAKLERKNPHAHAHARRYTWPRFSNCDHHICVITAHSSRLSLCQGQTHTHAYAHTHVFHWWSFL